MDHTVTVYSTPTCSWCQAAKDHFQNHGIAFEDGDVSADKVIEILDRYE